MDFNDFIYHFIYTNSARISSPDQLDSLGTILDDNLVTNGFFLDPEDSLDSAILEQLSEEALCEEFNPAIVRRSLELGFYPMSMAKAITSLQEIDIKNLSEDQFLSLHGKNIRRNLLAVKYHSKKLIVQFDSLHISKKLKGWLKGKFADYTITFNRNYSLCVQELLNSYPETWLCPELLEQYELIHNNPGPDASIDSVEIWKDGKLVAGEIGFITHNAYASLSGFHKEDDIGTVQMCVLGLFLKHNGFAYWDLGMELDYKYRYGAKALNRQKQEELYSTLGREKLSFPKEEIPLSSFLEYL